MTSPPDEKDEDLAEYLGRRSEISRRYQSSATEEPPAELDRAVLAQARAAVKGTSSNVSRFPARRTRWMVPFAVAATVLLSFAIFRDAGVGIGVLLQESSTPVTAPANAQLAEEREAKAADASTDGAVTSNSTPAERRLAAPSSPRAEQDPARDETASRASGIVFIAPDIASPPPFVPPPEIAVNQPIPAPATNAIQVVSNQRPPPAAPPAAGLSGPRATVPNQPQAEAARGAAGTQDAAKEKTESRTPEVWLEDIRKLRAAGKTAEADAELLLFTVTYPDYFEKNPGIARP